MDWPPPSRRMSTTRREQNLALLGALASGAVIAVALVLLLLSRANPENSARLRGTAIDVVAPVWSVVRIPFDLIGTGFGYVGDYIGAASRNRDLEKLTAQQARALQTQAAITHENQQLRSLLKVVTPDRRVVASARIAGASSGAVIRSAVVSAGSANGVAVGQPVRVAAGLVGRTVEVGASATRVLLLTDANSRIPVTIVRTGQSALVVGASRALVEVRERVGAEVPLVAGDRLVTSGDGGVFPPGIPVAVVVDGSQEPPLARPFVNPAGLGMVLIESAYLPVPATVPVETSTVAVPREAGGGRTKPSIITSTPRATASALPPPPAPVIAPPVAAAAKPAAPALKYVPRAMNVPLAAPVLSPTDTPAAPPQ
jgi:rod shape-determining protein MreC